MARGVLRVYLGASPGVGKTFAMLGEGHRRRSRGADVVVGVVETHGRAQTLAQLGDLEVVPRRTVDHRGASLDEMDVDAVLARRPDVVLVDELAHTNAPGSRHAKRWQDVEELLEAGIDVVSTLNIQHLESLNDVVEKITGVVQRETVPDAVVRAADQIELVDMSPEALRRRMAHGNVYPAERIDAALGNYFRVGNLGALRELALLWVADRAEDALDDYRARHGITATWETRERVVVTVTGAPGGDALVRRAARIAARQRGELVAVHVATADGLRAATAEPSELARHRDLVLALGGSYHEVAGEDVGATLVEFARAHGATQVVLGASHRSRGAELVRGSVVGDVLRRAGDMDVHVIARGDGATPARLPVRQRWRSPIPRRRQLIGWAIVAVGLPVLTVLLAASTDSLSLATDLLLFLAVVVAAGVAGGPLPGLTGAVVGSLLVNFFLVPPVHTFTIGERENVIALLVFLAVAASVSTYVHVAARRALDARRARAEAEALARAAGAAAAAVDPVPVLLGEVRRTFGCRSVELRRRDTDGWRVLATASDDEAPGAAPSGRSLEETVEVDVETGGDTVLVLHGAPFGLDDRLALRSHVDQLAVALRTRDLHEHAAEAAAAREADELRTGLLRAVSHDLRTPLASIKASVTSLLSPEIRWDDEQRHEFLRTVDAETDRLDRLVGNLLDMSRLEAGAVTLHVGAAVVDDVVANALASLSRPTDPVEVRIPEDVPLVLVDAELLERAVANVLGNALAWSPPGASIVVEAAAVGPSVHLRIADRGPGIPEDARAGAVRPFQRYDDRPAPGDSNGVGLGLAVASGFVHAMQGELVLDDTPGGGLTVVIELPMAPAAPLVATAQ